MRNLIYTIAIIVVTALSIMDLFQAITNESIPLLRRHSDVFLIKEPLFFWVEVTFRVIILSLVFFLFKVLIFDDVLKNKRNKKIKSNYRVKKKKKRKQWR